MHNHVFKKPLFINVINHSVHLRIMKAISTHNFELLESLLNQQTDDLTIMNALYTTIHNLLLDSKLESGALFNLDKSGIIDSTQLTTFKYLLELLRADNKCDYDTSTNILNTVIEYAIRYKLLAIDIKMINILTNTKNNLNLSLMLNHIMLRIPKDYNDILLKLLFNKKTTPNYLEEIYQELQKVFAKKLYTSITLMIKVTADLDNSLVILKSYLDYVNFKQHSDLKNILLNTMELLNNKKTHTTNKVHYISECILLLYSNTLINKPIPLYDTDIENSRLFKIYRHYPNMTQN